MSNLISLSGAQSSQFLDEEEDDELNVEDFFEKPDSIVFAIDCSSKMLVPDDQGNIPLQIAFQCVQSVLLNKAFNNRSDMIGVLLYGTKQAMNPSNYDHIYILQTLDSPDPGRIKAADDLAKGNNDRFRDEIGSSDEEFPLGNVFWLCSDMFAAAFKRIFLITNEDNPHKDNPSLRGSSLQRAKDLWDMGMRVELFGLDQPDHSFDYSLFYKEMMMLDNENDDVALDSRISSQSAMTGKVEDLLNQVRRKQASKRSNFSIPMHITPELSIGIRGYSIIMEQGRGSYTKVTSSGSMLQEVETVTSYKCADTDQFLADTDVKYFYPFGGKPALFTKDEVLQLRRFDEPHLRILGFKPRSSLQPHHNIASHSYFIYPNEMEYEGSTRTFAALLEAVKDQDKIAIAYLITRRTSAPSMVALLPQTEELGADGVQILPPGFQMIILPYADDIRQVPPSSEAEVTGEQIDALNGIIDDLMVDHRYDPMAYKNPSLQRHYSALQSISLDEPSKDIVDDTIPNQDIIDKAIACHSLSPFQ
ncbi:Ku DNA-binding complex, Ku70 subunit [Hesseltinella vesiculosa]|uniref:ATP-dependent DNA helicase II subunit 1 n=1 Tax=Hesseltinella vesiculosa TaxID=101127 RepID=A0A1X2GV80_9FUNG|nr:Ku DNA-binding complex, Ku70 subunit [Hesseltinella vesiculosa]